MGRQVTRRPRETPTPSLTPHLDLQETERPTTYGVEEGADRQPIMALLKDDHNDASKPYCTCTSRKHGYGFDPQLGVYLHADPMCWRPSKSYYEAARQAGVLAPERGSSGDEEARGRGSGEQVRASSADRRETGTARRRPRRPVAAREEVPEDTAGRAGEVSGADAPGGGDVLGERSNRTPRRARRSRDTTALWSDQY